MRRQSLDLSSNKDTRAEPVRASGSRQSLDLSAATKKRGVSVDLSTTSKCVNCGQNFTKASNKDRSCPNNKADSGRHHAVPLTSQPPTIITKSLESTEQAPPSPLPPPTAAELARGTRHLKAFEPPTFVGDWCGYPCCGFSEETHPGCTCAECGRRVCNSNIGVWAREGVEEHELTCAWRSR